MIRTCYFDAILWSPGYINIHRISYDRFVVDIRDDIKSVFVQVEDAKVSVDGVRMRLCAPPPCMRPTSNVYQIVRMRGRALMRVTVHLGV